MGKGQSGITIFHSEIDHRLRPQPAVKVFMQQNLGQRTEEIFGEHALS
jgi:hypothetical protein